MEPAPAGPGVPARPWLRLNVAEEEGADSFDERDMDTPREYLGAPPRLEALPISPSQRRTKSRVAFYRSGSFTSKNSLKDSKVLMVTGMKRTDSLLQPDLFRYHDHFEFEAQLGRTQLSEVFRVRHRQTGELYAVKRSRRRFKSKLHRERCLREISAVAALPAHPNVVAQYRAWQEGGHFYIQMDLCQGGSLHQLVAAAGVEGSLLSNEEVWTVAWEVASGLEFLHGHGVLHLDIKPENIYRDSNGTCQIGDFGLAVSAEAKEWWEEGDGDYVAPELLRSHSAPSPAADIYSLGATLFECAAGVKLVHVLQGGEPAAGAALPGRPPALQSLVRWMLQPLPDQRPTATQVLQYIQDQGQGGALLLLPGDAAGGPSCGMAEPPEAGSAANTPTPAASPSVATLFAGGPLPSPFAAGGPGAEAGAELGVPPCPFVDLAQESSGGCEGGIGGPAAAAEQPFSFAPVPQPTSAPLMQPGGWQLAGGSACSRGAAPAVYGDGASPAATPLARLPRRGGRMSGLQAAVARRAAGAVGGLQRWVPSLSPLVSEGALTPGALARLSPFSTTRSGLEPELGPHSHGSTPVPAPHSHSTPSSPMLSPAAGVQHMQHSSDSREGWRLNRRDMVSPDSDALARSVTESDLYSFSCGTGGSVSSLEFLDTGCAAQPTSPEFQSARNAPFAQATPELFQRAQPAAVPADAGGPAPPHPPETSSLAWDLHTSPEFLVQLPPGSPASPAVTVADSLHCRSFSSIRRFPTLDSMESMQLDGSAGGHAAAAGAKAPAECASGQPGRISSFTSIPHRLTSSFAQPVPEGAAGAIQARGNKRPLSRHNSRRGLLAVLSREGSFVSCGSLDQTQLQRVRHDGGGGERLLNGNGGPGTEPRQRLAEAGAACEGALPALCPQGLQAAGSTSSLQAAAAASSLASLQASPLREKFSAGMSLGPGSVAQAQA